MSKIKLELLAPARNAQIAIEAIKHGADAVYMGANRFGARAMAGNSLEDIQKAVDYAHRFNAKVYVTVNTILFEHELKDVEKLIKQLYLIGVDALIIQDMSILRLDLPPIQLHASTQCDIRNSEKALFLEKMGFSQLVLARELTIEEIKKIREQVSVPLEAFIHGALCVSYSGRCGLSYACMKRSANRGECAQMCRLLYRIEDENGNILAKEKHYLSLKDLSRGESLRDLVDAGITSFKIEGRLKDVDYVKNVVAYYRLELDKIINESPDKYERSSIGQSIISIDPKLEKVFNRGFSSYFLSQRLPYNGCKMASIDTPKSQGEYIGNVLSIRKGNILRIDTKFELSNGDGLSYFDEDTYAGFRINKVVGDDVYISNKLKLKRGTKLYRTFDKKYTDQLNGITAERFISIDIILRYCNNVLALDVVDERGNSITVSICLESVLEKAKSPQTQKQEEVLKKLGSTIYKVRIIKTLGELFIPSSMLADLKRKAIELLDKTHIINYRFEYRKPEQEQIPYIEKKLSHTDNVCNSLSEQFYKEHGVETIVNAIEAPNYKFTGNEELMHTRYCLLRELGWCRKDKSSPNIPRNIYLVNNKLKFLVETDCVNCEMRIRKSDN